MQGNYVKKAKTKSTIDLLLLRSIARLKLLHYFHEGLFLSLYYFFVNLLHFIIPLPLTVTLVSNLRPTFL